MSAVKTSLQKRRLMVPFILLVLALFALIVSLSGLWRTAYVTGDRFDELAVAWQAVQEGAADGSELVAADRLMSRLSAPMPLVESAARWTLGLAAVVLILFLWLVVSARKSMATSSPVTGPEDYQLRAAHAHLTQAVSPLIDGDLTVRADIRNDSTRALAETVNHAVGELRWLVSTLGTTAEQVNRSVHQSRQATSAVAVRCAEQSRQIHLCSNHLLTMSATMAELSADAAESSGLSERAVERAASGVNALSASLDRLSAISNEADNTTHLMHRLAENVGAIDERIIVIQDVARQTDLLALNTTIRASAGTRSATVSDAAADLGRLADEVALLAEVLGQATRDIGSLTRTITQDAADTVGSMEHTRAELAAGLEQTKQASEVLKAIQRQSDELHDKVTRIADKTVEQSTIVHHLSGNMDLINRIAMQIAESIESGGVSFDELQELSRELQQTASGFRLPVHSRPVEVLAAPDLSPVSPARKAADRVTLADRTVMHE